MAIKDKYISDKVSNGVYIAKGIAIIFVVIGHYHPYYPKYWRFLTHWIYTFHMPVFMFLSGFLFAKKEIIASFNEYKDFIKNKAKRLLLPYASVTLIALLLKTIGGYFFELSNPINKQVLWHIFINPTGGFIDILWFIYVLFEIFIIFPLLLLLIRKKIILLILLFILSFFTWPKIFVLDKLFFHLPVFAFGFIVFDYRQIIDKKVSFVFIVLLIYIMCFTILFGLKVKDFYIINFLKMSLGITGALTVYFLSIKLSGKNISKILYVIGTYSMSIYLFHTISFAPVHIIFFKIFLLNEKWFLLSSLFALAAAIIIPSIMEKYIFRNYKFLKLIIIGKES